MYLHFLIDSIYTNKFVKFIDRNFNSSQHVFILFDRNPKFLNTDRVVKPNNLEFILKKMLEAKAIFLHSLFDLNTLLLLLKNEKYLSKTLGVLWGGDLYNYWLRNHHSDNEQKFEKIKSFIIKNINGIISLVEEDYYFAKQKYNTKAKYVYAFYPNPIDFEMLDSLSNRNLTTQANYILVGNSASPTNNHFDILNSLARYQLKNTFIICPLSYGGFQDYANQVHRYGRTLFGGRFIAIREFLSPSEYANILANINVAIFAHKRQQALGNILTLLYLGKKVYVRSDVSTWNFLNRLGIKVFDTIKILERQEKDLFSFDNQTGTKNREVVKFEFSEERCVQLWKAIFDEFLFKRQ